MLLRTKIILGFSLVLLLTAITGVSAMYLTSVSYTHLTLPTSNEV